MIEPLGPNMVRTIIGDYDPDYTYQLETNDDGMRIIVINKKTGDSQVRPLEDTVDHSQHIDPLYDDDRLSALRTYHRRGLLGAVLAVVVCLLLCVAAAIATILIQQGGH